MELKNKAFAVVGTLAIGLGLTAGVASAQVVDTASTGTSVDIDCDHPITVELGGSGVFEPIPDILVQDSTQTQDPFVVTVDVGCYLGPWQVNATVTAFVAGPGQFFTGDHFSLTNPVLTDYAFAPVSALAPEVDGTDFVGFIGGVGEDSIFQTRQNIITLPWWLGGGTVQLPDTPAPFVSTAEFDGALTDLPFVIPGEYEAVLTVTLATD